MDIFTNTNIDFIGTRKLSLGVLGGLLIIGLVSMIVHHGFNYGVDFRGGTAIQVKFKMAIAADKVREALSGSDLGDFTIQHYGSEANNEILIRLAKASELNTEQQPSVVIEEKLKAAYPDQFEIEKVDSVGPSIGEELKTSAKWAILAALGLMLVYITIRFEFKYGVAAIIALTYDVMFTLGAISLTNREIDMTVVAALLTVVGYSINDKIVVFDRIRENLRLMHEQTLEVIVNRSINQTLSRTLLTGLTTIVMIFFLFLFGGKVINDFPFTMLVGIIIGTVTSITIATSAALLWDHLKPVRKHGKSRMLKSK